MKINSILCAALAATLFSGCAVFTGYEAQNQAKINELTGASEMACDFSGYEYAKDLTESGKKLIDLSDAVYNGSSLGLKALLCKDYEKSYEFFTTAIYTDQSKSTAAKAGAAIMSSITNDNIADYRFSYFEKPTAMAYAALDVLAIGDLQGAYAALRKAKEAQRESLNEFISEQIKQQDKLLANAPIKGGYFQKLAKQVANDNASDFSIKRNEPLTFDKARMMSSASFKNTFIDYIFGVVSYLHGNPGEASAVFKNLALIKNNKRFYEDQKITSHKKNAQKYVWVVYENGLSKPLKEFKLSLPVPQLAQDENGHLSFNGQLGLVSFAMSKLGDSSEAYPFIEVNGAKSFMLSDMDDIVTSEYKATLSTRILSAIINTAIKTATTVVAASQDKTLGLVVGVFNMLTNKSDVRYFIGLPKNYQAVRVKNTGKLVIKANNEIIEEGELDKNKDYLVYVKAPAVGQNYIQYFHQ